jgi:hypothetical protein
MRAIERYSFVKVLSSGIIGIEVAQNSGDHRMVPIGENVQVVVSIAESSNGLVISVDPWGNCPSEVAKEEGRFCNECEFWGKEVRGVDWAEFSLCYFKSSGWVRLLAKVKPAYCQ